MGEEVAEKTRLERVRRRAHELWEWSGRAHGRDREHWEEAERQIAREDAEHEDDQNEGEGSRSAARDYNERTERFVRGGQVDASARAAERAVEGAEGASLREAEKAGKKHSHGEDPEITQAAPRPPRKRK